MQTLLSYFGRRPRDKSFELYTDGFAQSGQEIVRQAYEEAKSLKQHQLAPEHLLIAFAKLEHPVFNKLLHDMNLDPRVVRQALSAGLSPGDHTAESMMISEQFRSMLSVALKKARENGRGRIDAVDLLIGLFADARTFPVTMFEHLGVDHETVLERIQSLDANR